MNARRVVLEWCQFVAQHMQGVDGARIVEIFQILLLQQQKLHLDEICVLCGELHVIAVDDGLEFLEIVVGLMPVAAENMIAKLCGGWMFKAAARFLHQHLCGAIETNELQMLTHQAHNVAIRLVELYAFDWLQVVIVICVVEDAICWIFIGCRGAIGRCTAGRRLFTVASRHHSVAIHVVC